MSSGAAPEPTQSQRTIGEILLAHGYVDQDQLDKALDRQRETGFPLGQILVEAGAITRLELASALAVQWSDMPIAVRVEDAERRSGLATADGAERKARLAPTESLGQEDLRALAARLEQIESSMAGLASHEGDADSTETGHAIDELRARLAASEELLAGTSRRAAEALTPSDLEDRLGTLAAALETALSRADELEARIATLAAQVGEVASRAETTATELERRSSHVNDVLATLAQRVDERQRDEALATRVEEISRQLEALPGSDRLDELNRFVAALSERPSSDPVLAARVDELADRVAALREAPELGETVDALQREVALLSERPAGDPGLALQVEELDGRVAALTQSTPYEELHSRVEELAARPVADPGIATRLEDLETKLSSLEEAASSAGHSGAAAEVAAMVTGVAEATDALSRQLAETTQLWASQRDSLELRLDKLAEKVARERKAAAALPPATQVPGTTPTAGADDLNRLWFAVERISLQLTEHHRDIELLLGGGSADNRLEELAARLDDLEDSGLGVPWPGQDQPGDTPVVVEGGGPGSRALERKLNELEKAAKSEREKLLTQIEQMIGSLEWRLQRLESTGAPAQTLGT